MYAGTKALLEGADLHNCIARSVSLNHWLREERLDVLVQMLTPSEAADEYLCAFDSDPDDCDDLDTIFPLLSGLAAAFTQAGLKMETAELFLKNYLSGAFGVGSLSASCVPAKVAHWYHLVDNQLQQCADECGWSWQQIGPVIEDYLWSSLHWLDQHESLPSGNPPDTRQEVARFLGEMVQFRLDKGGAEFDDPVVGPWKRIAIKYAQPQKADPEPSGAVFCNRLQLAIADSVGETGGSTELVLRLNMLVAALYFDALLSNPVGRELLYTFKLRNAFAPWVELFTRSWSGLSQARQRYLLADSWPNGSFNTREQFITIGVAAGLLGHKPGRTCVAAYLDGSLPKEP